MGEVSVNVYKKLEQIFRAADLHRPMSVDRYEDGTELTYDVTGVAKANQARVRVRIEKFVGGGFAGQVYRVRLLEIDGEDAAIDGLKVDGVYAMKILIPPSGFSRLFRNALYWIGFQGPFQLQVNPVAARAGALWQKFFRRGAKVHFGDERAVVDIYATFIDKTLGSCGELSEWVDGRTWRLEVDEYLDLLKKWKKGKKVDESRLGSPEYRSKYVFMHQFVDLLHEMGGYEFARQYEWTTCKSQPNCLKRLETDDNPQEGLVAVDFRAGLALLPFLPMSPGDFMLIGRGILRGSLVQFDRGSLKRLEKYVEANSEHFQDMRPALEELKTSEKIYRESVPDITHNHFKLLFKPRLWSTIFNSAITGWTVRGLIDDKREQKFRRNKILALLFMLLGFVPVLGRVIRKMWARPEWRQHYKSILTSWDYFVRAARAKLVEKTIRWHRAGRMDDQHALDFMQNMKRAIYHIPLSILPVGLHRFFTDWQYARDRLDNLLIRPFRLYFNADLRAQWLRDMVAEGKKKNLLSNEDAEIIESQVDEPFIQKYLKSLAVHLATLPVTQIVSVLVAAIYVATHPEMPRSQAYGIGLGIIALFQVVPISPGSLTRGLYVVYLVIRERNFKDYNIAVFLGFFKYIGYLAFPIQMAYRYPALARFMAGHWATEAVHIVPVFGERGALLEHWVFSLFYNWPLTIRRRIKARIERRMTLKPRYWHTGVVVALGVALFLYVDSLYLNKSGQLPTLKSIWWMVILVPGLCGMLVTMGARGAAMSKRVVAAALTGLAVAAIYTGLPASIGFINNLAVGGLIATGVWRAFLFTIFSIIGMLITEMKLPETWRDR